MGTGFLTLPWAFQSSGVLLGLATLISVAIVCDLSKTFVLEAMVRAELSSSKHSSSSQAEMESQVHEKQKLVWSTEPLLPDNTSATASPSEELVELPYVKEKKFEIVEL